jgi:hypothetical protein
MGILLWIRDARTKGVVLLTTMLANRCSRTQEGSRESADGTESAAAVMLSVKKRRRMVVDVTKFWRLTWKVNGKGAWEVWTGIAELSFNAWFVRLATGWNVQSVCFQAAIEILRIESVQLIEMRERNDGVLGLLLRSGDGCVVGLEKLNCWQCSQTTERGQHGCTRPNPD